MSNYLFISSDTPSELLVPITPVNHELEAISDSLIYVPLATRNTYGIIKVGEGLNIDGGVLSFDRNELDVKLSTNVGSENANKFLYVSDNGNITFVDQVQNITKVSELENDTGYITKDVDNLANYYTILRVDSLFDTALASAEEAKAIAIGKPGSKTFDTYGDMITWLGDENHIGELIVGASLYIKAEGPDYWVTDVYFDSPIYVGQYPSYYGISPLESKLPDITNMMTTDTPQVVSEYKIFNKYVTFNEDIRTNNIYSTKLKNLISVSDNKLKIGSLEGNDNLVLESYNRPTIQIINNTPEDIAFVSEIPTKVSELENDEVFLKETDIVDSLWSTSTTRPLSANAGRDLNLKVEDKLDIPEVYRGPKEVYVGGQIWTDAGTSTKSVFTPDVRIIGDSITIKKNTTNGGSLYAEGKIYQGGKEVANKEDIPETQDVPTKISQLENDSGFITADEIPESGTLYDTPGQNTDGAMTQKAATDNFATKDEVLNNLPIWFTDNITTTGGYVNKTEINNHNLKVGDYFYIFKKSQVNDSTSDLVSNYMYVRFGKVTQVYDATYKYDVVEASEITEGLTHHSGPTLEFSRMYKNTGTNLDGSMTQAAITAALNNKANLSDFKYVVTGAVAGVTGGPGGTSPTASSYGDSTGYMKFPNGFTIQWQWIYPTANKADQAYNFPIAYTKFLGIAINWCTSSVNDIDNMSAHNFRENGFSFTCGHSSSINVCVVSFGYIA